MHNDLPIKINLPEGFLQEEIRNDHKVTREVKEIWAVELDLLVELDRVCKANGLTYYVDSGTLLGAIRHKGFIPWDDDIDVIMLRDDYEKLCSVADKEFRHPYFFQTEYSDPGSMRGHAQLRNSLTTGILEDEKDSNLHFNQGLFIDVFVVDYVPDEANEQEAYFEQARKLLYEAQRHEIKLRKNADYERGIIKLYHNLTHLLNKSKANMPNEAYREFENYVIENDRKKTDSVCKIQLNIVGGSKILKAEWIKGTVEMPFEFISVPVPIEYEEVLKTYFGKNWMIPMKSGSMHGGMIIDVRKPYTEYLK